MGLAASQARFLMITARLSNLEFEGQQINQARSELADKTARAAAEYQQAISNRRLLFDPLRQVYNSDNDYQVFTYDTIVNSVEEGGLGMRLVNKEGKIIVPNLPNGIDESMAEANNYIVDDKVYDSNYLEYNLRNNGWNLQQPNTQTRTSWSEYDLVSIYAEQNNLASDKVDTTSNAYQAFLNNFKLDDITKANETFGLNLRLIKGDQEVVANVAQARTANPIVDANLINYTGKELEDYIKDSGYKITIGKVVNYIAGWLNTDWHSTEGIFDTLDQTDDGEAEAKYIELSSKYQAQDKKLELRQKQIDSEHNAVQTEYDAIKKVLDKNVENTFKTFG